MSELVEPPSSILLPTIFFLISLGTRAIFSFLETSITALRLFKLKELEKQTQRHRYLFRELEKNPHRVLMTILIANNIADVITAALATIIAGRVFAKLGLSSQWGFSIGIGIASIAIIIFGEILPKNFARSKGEGLFLAMLGVTNFVYRLLSPITSFFLSVANKISVLLTGYPLFATEDWVTCEKEVQFLIDYINEKGLIDKEKTTMLKNIFNLGNTLVKEVMVPNTDVVSIEVTIPIDQVIKTFTQYRYTRLPVYDGKPSNVIGMVHHKDVVDLVSHGEQKTLRDIMRPIMFVPETVKINQLLQDLRSQHMHIAMVINEHGSIVGLITLEDAIEEIVGEISDEHEATVRNIVPLPSGGWLVNAQTSLEELESYFKITFDVETSSTLGGFLTEKLQHLPQKGERVIYEGYCFQIQKASMHRVRQVLVIKVDEKSGVDW